MLQTVICVRHIINVPAAYSLILFTIISVCIAILVVVTYVLKLIYVHNASYHRHYLTINALLAP